MRAYFDYLRKTDRNIYRVRDGVEDLEWHASITTRFIPLQHDHAADSVTIDDHRDPIDYRELRKDLEFTYSEIRMLLEEYKDVDEVKPWHYLKY